MPSCFPSTHLQILFSHAQYRFVGLRLLVGLLPLSVLEGLRPVLGVSGGMSARNLGGDASVSGVSSFAVR